MNDIADIKGIYEAKVFYGLNYVFLPSVVPWLRERLQQAYGDQWWEKGVAKHLIGYVGLDAKLGNEPPDILFEFLDVTAILRIISNQLGILAHKRQLKNARNSVENAKVTRNSNAHIHLRSQSMTAVDCFRALDDIAQLLEALDVPNRDDMRNLANSVLGSASVLSKSATREPSSSGGAQDPGTTANAVQDIPGIPEPASSPASELPANRPVTVPVQASPQAPSFAPPRSPHPVTTTASPNPSPSPAPSPAPLPTAAPIPAAALKPEEAPKSMPAPAPAPMPIARATPESSSATALAPALAPASAATPLEVAAPAKAAAALTPVPPSVPAGTSMPKSTPAAAASAVAPTITAVPKPASSPAPAVASTPPTASAPTPAPLSAAAPVPILHEDVSMTRKSPGKLIAYLKIVESNAELPLPDQDEVFVGRSDMSTNWYPQIDLTPHGGEPCGVSRRHACLLLIESEYFVKDLRSTNFTKLNGKRLAPDVHERIKDGDRIDFARVGTIFRLSGS